jgi:hypothetical protein
MAFQPKLLQQGLGKVLAPHVAGFNYRIPCCALRHGAVRCSASGDEGAAPVPPTPPSQPSAPPKAVVRSTLPPGRVITQEPINPNIKFERLETLSKDSWGGVAGVDRGESDDPTNWGRIALIVGGDVSALLLFAAVGRGSHGEVMSLVSVAGTAAPFLAGWLGAAVALGSYGKAAQGGNTGAAAAAAAKAWAVGIPVGLAIRSVVRGYLPETVFIGVTLAVTAVLLVGWRSALAAATPEAAAPATPAEALKRRKNKKGNPFEFLQLLSGLVGRW